MSQKLPRKQSKQHQAEVLTERKADHIKGVLLVKEKPRPFVLCFEEKLEKGYTFSELEKRDLKAFQNFLDRVSGKQFPEVEKVYKRISDKKDKHDNEQMIHFEVSKPFRIHGIIRNGKYVVIRLDPNHNVHNK